MTGTAALKSTIPNTFGVFHIRQQTETARFVKESLDDATEETQKSSAGKLTEPAVVSSKSGLKVINFPVFNRVTAGRGEFFAATQEWEGYVTAIYDDYFTADLRDVTANEDDVGEVAEIPIDAISPDDRSKLVEGLVFRWLVGYSKTKSLQYSKKQIIYIRASVAKPKGEIDLVSTAAALRSRFTELPQIEL